MTSSTIGCTTCEHQKEKKKKKFLTVEKKKKKKKKIQKTCAHLFEDFGLCAFGTKHTVESKALFESAIQCRGHQHLASLLGDRHDFASRLVDLAFIQWSEHEKKSIIKPISQNATMSQCRRTQSVPRAQVHLDVGDFVRRRAPMHCRWTTCRSMLSDVLEPKSLRCLCSSGVETPAAAMLIVGRRTNKLRPQAPLDERTPAQPTPAPAQMRHVRNVIARLEHQKVPRQQARRRRATSARACTNRAAAAASADSANRNIDTTDCMTAPEGADESIPGALNSSCLSGDGSRAIIAGRAARQTRPTAGDSRSQSTNAEYGS
jgi:hypothetical protein